ncbi:collagen-like protein [Lactiplantibacillus plantarum]|uniref:collagen-like protein n=1 Tax=Lactiplantibacillus plantarum TaxID=1590 RepID=UPI0032DF26B8
MDKTLEFTTKSPRQIKQGDTETTFTFICKDAGSAIDLTQATSITAKIGNDSGYLRSQSIAITSLAGLKPGWLNLQPMPTLIAGLPAGNYQLEIWVIDQAGTSIYPSDKPLGFTITNNIQSTNGATITTITFDDFVEAMNKVASTIKGEKGDKGGTGPQGATGPQGLPGPQGAKGDKGDKGDTGTVDNAGLTTAPAFVELKTQVTDSAVGTNLLINTSSSSTNGRTQIPGAVPAVGGVNKYSRTDSYEQVTAAGNVEFYYRFMSPSITNLYGLTPGGTYTLSGSASHTSGELKFRSEYSAGGGYYSLGNPSDLGIPVSDGSVFIPFSYTFTVPVGTTGIYISLQNDDYTAGGLFRFKNMKLEKGNVATDWCPNPTDILTQADYAKIKAAIVALGGSLS